MNEKDIRKALENNRIQLTPELPEKLYRYLTLLKEWNSRIDLTAITDDEETVDKHFIDSLTILNTGMIPVPGTEKTTSLIDVGTGAGFPGMVLALACPEMTVTLLDAQQKRLGFLHAVAEATQTSNVTLIHARAEDGGRKPELREQFDFAAARALAPLNTLLEYLLPFVRISGYALCWKGPAVRGELDAGNKAARILGGQTEMPVRCPVNGRDWDHMILPVRKIRPTGKNYPRKAGMPKNNPLGV